MTMNRREMLTTLGAVGTGLVATEVAQLNQVMGHPAAPGSPNHTHGPTEPPPASTIGFDANKGEYVLPPLPYAYDALEPVIDAQTMQLHHTRHHQAYVTGLNNALKKLAEARGSSDFALVKHWSREVSFNGGGHALHTLFWNNMQPVGRTTQPSVKLMRQIARNFGSLEGLQNHFNAAATGVEGGGWAILGYEPLSTNLIIIQAEKQQDLTVWGMTPLLALDVWEHAYYLKYQNRRADYVKAWWEVVNWNDVSARWQSVIHDQT